MNKPDFLDFIQYNFGMYTDGNINEDDFLQAVEEYMFGVSKLLDVDGIVNKN